MSEHDAEQRVRAALGDLGYSRNITVTPDDLREVLRQLDEARAQLADYENRITWHTTCKQCAADLDRAIADCERAEMAECQLAAARDTAALANLRLTGLLASIRAVAEPLEALAIGAGGTDCDLRLGIALRHARALTALAGTADTTSNEGN